MNGVINNCLLPAILWAFLLFTGCQSQPGIQYPPGGYDYPVAVSGRDSNFYYYPIRNKFSRRDSFGNSFDYIIYQGVNELNMSLKPLPVETFRLSYGTAFHNYAFITLTKYWLTIKKGTPEEKEPFDSLFARLPPIEAEHLRLLQRRYPLDAAVSRPSTRRYLDSMIRLYPQLLDVQYYYRLGEKLNTQENLSFKYDITTIPITIPQYNAIVQAINKSGYWSMPHVIDCKAAIADGYTFMLEANTKSKYNMVSATGCPGDTSAFTNACQEIIKLAWLDKEIGLPWPKE